VGAIALCGLTAILATARGGQVDATPAAPAAESQAVAPPVDPAWMIPANPIERMGYREGRRQVFEVVPLGPNAVEVELSTARAFLAMRAAAAEAGIDLGLVSGFRSVAQQRALFRAWRKGRGNRAARPGESNHQSGRALDIAVTTEPGAVEWLESNGALFGFKRTVKSEPWHWEYVEVPVARGATRRVAKKKLAKALVHAKRPASVKTSVRPARRVTASRR